ncbi:MAG: efflux RND transporter periplasmic adaptor subunit [Phycisphaerae bacterium]|nr:efflux RND transporter periplasmic adaptor subunit [Phycisphaerae bacterium]
MSSHRTAIVLSVILGLGILQPSLGFANGTEAVTKPSQDVTLSFLSPGRIAKVLVKAGDVVSADDPLVKQDDAAEQLKLEQLQAQALDSTKIQAAQAELDQKEVDLDKLEKGRGKGVVTLWELDHARLDVKIAELRLALRRFEHKQDQRKFDEARIHVERMKMASPIAGKVEEIFVEPGESVNALDEVIRVVRINPLWIDVPVPLDDTWNLELEQAATVEFKGPNPLQRKGRIIHIAAVADAASNTRTVRVEVPNKTQRPAGEHVKVSFPPVGRSTVSPKDKQVPQISLDDNIKE